MIESDPVIADTPDGATAPRSSGASPTTTAWPPLTAAGVTVFLTRVTTAVLPTTPLGLVGLLKVLTLLINALTCLQARAQAALLAARRAEAKDAGRSVRPVRGAVIQQIGLACRLSPYQAAEHLKRATTLPTRLPRTWNEWQSGEITMERAATVIKETRPLDPEKAGQVDAEVAPGLGNRSKREAEHLIRTAVTDADPQAAAERARLAHEDRYASAHPAGDGMISFHALIPGLEGQAIWTGLEERATSIRNHGDERSKEQIKADTLTEALISYLTYLKDTDTDLSAGTDPAAAGGAAEEAGGRMVRNKRPRPAVQIQLVMTDAALFGYSDTTARALGLGPIPAPLARTWAREAIEDERAELIRLYTKPGTGQLVAMDSKRRTFPTSLTRYVVTRDEICRTPWCGAPIRHIDHVTPHQDGGPTSLANAQGLCIQCNQHKDGPGWKHQSGTDLNGTGADTSESAGATDQALGAVTVTTPTGDTYTTQPEPLPHDAPPTLEREAALGTKEAA
jgi:hypothetical protein